MLSKQTGIFRQVAIIANNVANVNTTGFKADNLVYERFPVKLDTPDHKPKSVDYTNDIGTYISAKEGQFQETDNPLDVAIHGPGYFIVQSPLGVRYTRAGDFTLDGNGQMVNAQGYAVLDPNGQPIVFQPGDKDILIQSDGTITAKQDGSTAASARGQIGVALFPNTQLLQKLPNSLFAGPAGGGGAQQPSAGSFQMAQGMIEKSNVDSVTELSHLIEANRYSGYLSSAINSSHTLELKAIDTLNKQ